MIGALVVLIMLLVALNMDIVILGKLGRKTDSGTAMEKVMENSYL